MTPLKNGPSIKEAKEQLISEIREFDLSIFNVSELTTIKDNIQRMKSAKEETAKAAKEAQLDMNLAEMGIGF